MNSLNRLSTRMKELQDTAMSETHPVLDFDKDDVDTLDFVTSTANLRAAIFGIGPRSKFDTKREVYGLPFQLDKVANMLQRWRVTSFLQLQRQMP